MMDARMLMLWSTITQSAVRTRKVIKKRLQRSRERLHRARRRLLQWRINMTAMVFLALALEPVNRNFGLFSCVFQCIAKRVYI